MMKSVTLRVTEKMVDDFIKAYEHQSKTLQFAENQRLRVKQGICAVLGEISDQFIEQIITPDGATFERAGK
jgi:hypothetical protein